jgi:nucleotide-binding universal stress UspA family protein
MKIVVTTDFSDNSKKAIHFAIQLATQTKCELYFYHVVEIYMPTIWDNTYYYQFEKDELKNSQHSLEQFIADIYTHLKIQNQKYQCLCKVGISGSNEIINYAQEIKADYICVSTLGAGKFIQLFGTTASELISFSSIPVIIVPKNYHIGAIETLFFASDFKNAEEELKKIETFSQTVEAKLEVYHYDYNWFLEANKTKYNEICQKHQSENISFKLRKLDSGASLIKHLENDIDKTKPSLVVIFTKQNHNWFSQLFLSNLSSELAFDTKTPMLVLKKSEAMEANH